MSHAAAAAAAARLGRSKTPTVIRCVYTVYTQLYFNHQFRGIWRGREYDAQNAEPLNTRWISSRLPRPTLPVGPGGRDRRWFGPTTGAVAGC